MTRRDRVLRARGAVTAVAGAQSRRPGGFKFGRKSESLSGV